MTPELIKEMNNIQWSHQIDLGDGIVTPGYYSHTVAMASSYFGMPEDLTGKTVLDIGCSDGMFAFEAERRGASSVLAIDTSNPEDLCIGKPGDWPRGFRFAQKTLNSSVEFEDINIYDIDASWISKKGGAWDVVLAYGLIYHLKNPIGALECLSKLTKEVALIETTYCNSGGLPVWEYRPGHHGDPTNQWYPSYAGLVAALMAVGFKKVDLVAQWNEIERMTVRAEK